MGFVFSIGSDKDGSYASVESCTDPGRICAIPRMAEGVMVRRIASHALAGNGDIRELFLPDTIREIGSFAFYNCRNLESISFGSADAVIADGIVGFCRHLSHIEVTFREERFTFLRDLLGQTDRDLTVRLNLPDGQKAELFFPEYTEGMDEDTHARAFHPWCDGSGIAFRECVRRDGIDFAAYDRLLERAAADGREKACRISIARLMHPVSLKDEAAERYRSCLLENGTAFLNLLTQENQTVQVQYLLEQRLVSAEAAGEAALAAAERKKTELVSLLMAYARPEKKDGPDDGFDLDELL